MKSTKKARKTDIYKVLTRIGLKDVTTERQNKNGTIALYDSLAGCTYTFTALGYYRREYETTCLHTGKEKKNIYQLNPREDSWNGKTTVTFPGEYKKMMTLAVGPIFSYRESINAEYQNERTEVAKTAINRILNWITE